MSKSFYRHSLSVYTVAPSATTSAVSYPHVIILPELSKHATLFLAHWYWCPSHSQAPTFPIASPWTTSKFELKTTLNRRIIKNQQSLLTPGSITQVNAVGRAGTRNEPCLEPTLFSGMIGLRLEWAARDGSGWYKCDI